MIEGGGNSSANSIYEAFIPEGLSKPGPDAVHEERSKFIRSKYELREFLKPSLRINSGPSRKNSLQSTLQSNSFSQKIIDSFRSNSSQKSQEGMVEFIGLLKVKVIKGTNLPIRDMMTSNSYVILTFGKQTLRTTVIKSNLNPVWNEELTLSVPERFLNDPYTLFTTDVLAINLNADLYGSHPVYMDLRNVGNEAYAHSILLFAEVKHDLIAEEACESKKNQLAELGMVLISDPVCKDNNHAIVKLGLLSLLAVFKDIIPGALGLSTHG